MVEEWGSDVRWLGVYIAEAHTKDEWPMPCVNSPCRHYQPTTIEARAEHAREFIKNFRPPFPVFMDSYVDSWDDPFMSTFSAWPERFYVFQYFSDPDPGSDPGPDAGQEPDKTPGDAQPSFRVPRTGWYIRWWNMPSPIDGHRIDDIRDWLSAEVKKPSVAPPKLLRTRSEQLQEEQRMARVQEVFKQFDGENRGLIPKEKMEPIFESLGYLPRTTSAAFQEIDIDKSGEINLVEFEAFFRSIHPRLQQELLKQNQLSHVAEVPQKFVPAVA
eukprot:gb/GFBE01010469.1/.p1 GENE.gb/GFBE01010469.1/~~gb/GFBE01010469.1/.p1  ORF type:complete len:272 (+),score=45.38 gb/GFBE01010469.1/:1-816(+)